MQQGTPFTIALLTWHELATALKSASLKLFPLLDERQVLAMLSPVPRQ